MPTKPLYKKSSIITRRKVIVYMLATIFIVGIVAGFTNIFTSDNRRFAAEWGQTIVMEAAPPQTGSPEDYDLLSNLSYTAYTLHHATYFKGETSGTCTADIKLGSYTQRIYDKRWVLGENTMLSETVSSSSLKSVAEQKYADNGVIIYRPSTSVRGSSATFSNSAYAMSYKEYGQKYGSIPNQLSKYIINPATIRSVSDDNAHLRQRSFAAPAAQAEDGSATEDGATNDDNEDGQIKFEVPSELVPDADGNYKITLSLDPFESSLYYRSEVRTLGGSEQNPVFHSVLLTITFSSDWYPISVRTRENYDIEISGLGAMNCSSDITERFSMINDPAGEIPYRDFFQPYVDNARRDPNFVPVDMPKPVAPSDYLSSAFADYIAGNRNLDLKINAKADEFTAYDLKLSLNLKNMNVQAMLGDGLYVNYAADKVYVKLNRINGYMRTAAFAEAMKDNRLAALLGSMSAIDVNALFGGDMLGSVLGACEMTVENGVATIRLPFDVDLSSLSPSLGKAHIDASILINDTDKSLKAITGTIEIGGKTIEIKVLPLAAPPKFPSTANAVDLSPIASFIPDAIATAMQKTYGIEGSVRIDGNEIGIQAYIDRTEGIAADAVITAMGLDISVKYVNNVIYVGIGDIAVRGGISDIPTLVQSVQELLGANLAGSGKLLDTIKGLLPKSLNAILDMAKSIETDGNTLTLGFNILTAPVTITLKRENGAISHLGFTADIDILDFKHSAAVALDISSPERREIPLPDESKCITFAQLSELIKDVKPYIDTTTGYTLALSGSVYGGDIGTVAINSGKLAVDGIGGEKLNIAAKLDVTAFGQNIGLAYVNDEAYVSISDRIKVKATAADIQKLIGAANRLITKLTGNISSQVGSSQGIPQGLIKTLAVTEQGDLAVTLAVQGNDISVLLNTKTGRLEVHGDISGYVINLVATILPSADFTDITAPENARDYIAVSELEKYVAPIMSLVNDAKTAKTITIGLDDVSLAVMGQQLDITGKIDISLNPLIVRANLTLFAGTADESVLSILYADNTVYVKLGEIALSLDPKTDFDALYKSVERFIPAALKNPDNLGGGDVSTDGIAAMISGFKKLANANDAQAILSALCSAGGENAKSLVQRIIEMLNVSRNANGEHTVAIGLNDMPFSVALNVIPKPSADGKFIDFAISATAGSMFSVGMTVKPSLHGDVIDISAFDKSPYVSIIKFATTAVDAINTLTAKVPDEITYDANGNKTAKSEIAFEAQTFAFDYDIYKIKTEQDDSGNAIQVTDPETGRPVIETDAAGNKIIDSHISVNNKQNQKALRFGYVTTTVTDALGNEISSFDQVSIEAHVTIDIKTAGVSQLGFPIELDLYVAPTAEYKKGLAYVYYKEAQAVGAKGVKLSIDYTSIMELTAALMKIVGADDVNNATINALIGEYRKQLDTSIFDSMTLAGADTLRTALQGLATAIGEAKLALQDAKRAWSSVQAVTDMNDLIDELTKSVKANGTLTAKSHLTNAIEHIQTAVGAFVKDDKTDSAPAADQTSKLNGAMFGKVVKSIKFISDEGLLQAKVDSAIATGVSGIAEVTVKSSNSKIDSATVENLDVNTAKLNKFDLSFNAGEHVDVVIPTAEFVNDNNTSYSDFSKLKHLLFDLMNTANLKEFDIGGMNSSDTINIKLNLGAFSGLANMDLYIKYNAKVKLIETGKNEFGKSIYKPAASVELFFKDCKAKISGIECTVIPDCTTRLFLFDDMIYIQGINDSGFQQDGSPVTVGTVQKVDYYYGAFSGNKNKSLPIKNTEYQETASDVDYVEAMYTVDELVWMMQTDLSKFMYEFVFRLLPLSTRFTVAKINLQQTIVDQLPKSDDNAAQKPQNTMNTFAQIFKGYSYINGKHSLGLGLKELTGNNAMSNLLIDITGMNNDNDYDKLGADGKVVKGNMLDNYISKLYINTAIQNNLVEVDLTASLANVRVNNGMIASAGFAPTDITLQDKYFAKTERKVGNDSYTGSTVRFAGECKYYNPDILYTLDGLTYLAENAGSYSLYEQNGTFAPVRPANNNDIIVIMEANRIDRYVDDAGVAAMYKKWYYTINFNGLSYRFTNEKIRYYIGTNTDGTHYVYRLDGNTQVRVTVKSILSLLANVERDATGKITSVSNRRDGIQWATPWKAAYNAAHQSAAA